jgi:hypothetical protein
MEIGENDNDTHRDLQSTYGGGNCHRERTCYNPKVINHETINQHRTQRY